jgi:hypothetical protein
VIITRVNFRSVWWPIQPYSKSERAAVPN